MIKSKNIQLIHLTDLLLVLVPFLFGNLTVGQQFTQTDVSTIDSGDVNSDLGIINDIVINSDSILRNVTTPLLNANGFANFDSVGFVGNKITTRDSNADLVLQRHWYN